MRGFFSKSSGRQAQPTAYLNPTQLQDLMAPMVGGTMTPPVNVIDPSAARGSSFFADGPDGSSGLRSPAINFGPVQQRLHRLSDLNDFTYQNHLNAQSDEEFDAEMRRLYEEEQRQSQMLVEARMAAGLETGTGVLAAPVSPTPVGASGFALTTGSIGQNSGRISGERFSGNLVFSSGNVGGDLDYPSIAPASEDRPAEGLYELGEKEGGGNIVTEVSECVSGSQ